MDQHNPYASPQGYPQASVSEPGVVPMLAIRQLAETRPWVLFIAILMWIAVGIMAISGIVLFAGIGRAVSSASVRVGSQEAGAIGTVGVVWVIAAFLYLFPAIKLTKYAGKIKALTYTGKPEDLISALNEQRSFWKFVGIITIISIIGFIVMNVYIVSTSSRF